VQQLINLTIKVRTATCAGARAGRVEALASGAGGMQIAAGTFSGCITRYTENAAADAANRPLSGMPTIRSDQSLNTAPLHASVPDWDSNNSETNSPRVRLHIVSRPGMFMCDFANLRQVDWLSEGVPLPRIRIRAAHGTVPLKCACNTLPARPGILYRPAH
jgi:hypothetical protein